MIESLREGEEPIDRPNSRNRDYKLDLYSIPVFILEALLLIGLGYSAFYIHYQYKHEPLVNGLYCDDIVYRQKFVDSDFTNKFTVRENELTATVLLLTIPIILIIFCELVNSMFGALSFRQIRALCNCCKLHSITRRTLRFSTAYLLGFLIVMISCDILANSTGRLRPYFAQDCPRAYSECPTSSNIQHFPFVNHENTARDGSPPMALIGGPSQQQNQPPAATNTQDNKEGRLNASNNQSPSTIISQSSPPQTISPQSNPISSAQISVVPPPNRIIDKRQVNLVTTNILVERTWIDLNSKNLADICPKIKEAEESNNYDSRDRLQQIAMSWPSFPAAMLTYSVLFICCYLSFVGTARPFRLITCIIVMVLLLGNMIFNVHLVKEHYNHWEDVVSSTLLSLVVVIFILYVYLNKFKDSHYYGNQKLNKPKGIKIHENFRGYSNDGAIGEFNNLDKIDHIDANGSTNDIRSSTLHTGDIVSGSGNDVAMRYFQIPRANYRGVPRPLSSLNQQML